MLPERSLATNREYEDCIPIIAVRNLERAKTFYMGLLGFGLDFDGSEVVGLLKDRVQIYLIVESSKNTRQEPGTGNLIILTHEVDELFERCRSAGVDVIVEPDDRPYGQRDFALRDPDGNVLIFACNIN